jgi:hypothetical protein
VRFTVEIYSIGEDGTQTVLHRTSVTSINPAGALKEARRLLKAWEKRRASEVRVLNGQGQL